MNGIHLRRDVLRLLICLHHRLRQRRVRLRVPARIPTHHTISQIARRLLRRKGHSGHARDALQLVVHHVHLGRRRTAHGRNERNLGLKRLRDGARHRRLHRVLNGRRIALHAERTHIQEIHELRRRLLGNGQTLLLRLLHRECGLLFDLVILLLEAREFMLNALLERLHLLRRNRHRHHALARNSVVRTSALNRHDAVIVLSSGHQARHHVERVRTAEINVTPGVTADEVVQCQSELSRVLESLARCGQMHAHREASGAANANGVLLLGINVDHVLGLQNARLEVSRSVHTGLLIASHEHLQRTVLNRIVLQNGKARSNADTVIGTERGTRRHQPLVVHNTRRQRIGVKVDMDVVVLFHNHIHVALQADGGSVLIA